MSSTEPGHVPDPERQEFRRLPEPIAFEDMVASVDVRPVPDPDGGRDPNHEWMLRHG
ncbi:heme biosynthesis protein HemY [Cellulomonas sp. zg-ZUI199]|uniref:Heme biosynthesis protein HemY n=1 Tax=Cellulomonas wangleii TaxID=2816956 RepID=A0ABX8D2N3_9CELL|nr:heme biosynthesis protein HemY [Cellulomonas wangleii]MBO0923376.1 heme biosynthesis protein HemY [Cellulomonas wangleii]QVI61730.1 heme biosynthesis protein HemY [Cellulomonas wangleii]